MPKSLIPSYRIVLLGEAEVGKTALAQQLATSRFPEIHDPTIENVVTTKMAVDGQTTQLQLLDTAGEESLSCMIGQSIVNGNGFVLVYSVTSRESFDNIEVFYSQVIQIKETTDLGIIIVANKSDLDQSREISVEEGTKLARRLGVPIFEVSAKTRSNLVQAFNSIVKECSKRDEKESFNSSSSSSAAGGSNKKKKSRSTSISSSDIKNNVEIVVVNADFFSAPTSPKKSTSSGSAASSGGGGGCFGLFRRGRSRSESAPQHPQQQQQREIVVAHM